MMKSILFPSLNFPSEEGGPTALKCYHVIWIWDHRANLVRRKNVDDSDICLGQEEKSCEDVTKRRVDQNYYFFRNLPSRTKLLFSEVAQGSRHLGRHCWEPQKGPLSQKKRDTNSPSRPASPWSGYTLGAWGTEYQAKSLYTWSSDWSTLHSWLPRGTGFQALIYALSLIPGLFWLQGEAAPKQRKYPLGTEQRRGKRGCFTSSQIQHWQSPVRNYVWKIKLFNYHIPPTTSCSKTHLWQIIDNYLKSYNAEKGA